MKRCNKSSSIKKNCFFFTLAKKFEFDDGSEWALSKCLTHANQTHNLINIKL